MPRRTSQAVGLQHSIPSFLKQSVNQVIYQSSVSQSVCQSINKSVAWLVSHLFSQSVSPSDLPSIHPPAHLSIIHALTLPTTTPSQNVLDSTQVIYMYRHVTWGGGTPYNGLYGEALPERGAFFRLQVYKRVGISQF